MGQVAIVTGGSSGIGAAAAEYLAAHGCTVYEFSRHEKSGGSASVHHVTADVTDEASVAAAVQSVLDAEGRIDILLNNAGFGISGAASSRRWRRPSASSRSISGAWCAQQRPCCP